MAFGQEPNGFLTTGQFICMYIETTDIILSAINNVKKYCKAIVVGVIHSAEILFLLLTDSLETRCLLK